LSFDKPYHQWQTTLTAAQPGAGKGSGFASHGQARAGDFVFLSGSRFATCSLSYITQRQRAKLLQSAGTELNPEKIGDNHRTFSCTLALSSGLDFAFGTIKASCDGVEGFLKVWSIVVAWNSHTTTRKRLFQ
jgi:hypothetical protein